MRKKKTEMAAFFFFSIKGCVRYKVLFPAVVKYSFTSSFFSHGTQKKKRKSMIYKTYWDWGKKKNVKTNHSIRKTKKKKREKEKKTENSVISAAVLSALRRAARTPFRQCGANPLR